MRRMKLVLAALFAASCGPTTKPAPIGPTLPVTPVEPEHPAEPIAPEPPVAEVEQTIPAPPEDPPPPDLKWPEEDYRSIRPKVGAPRPLVQPKIAQFKLANGIQVYLVERHELPTISVDLVFEGGSENDAAGKEGEAELCMNLVDDGTEKLDKEKFEEAQADIASSVSAGASDDQQSIGMSTLTKNFAATLELWSATILTPGLRAEDHARNVKRAAQGIKQQKASPGGVSGRVFGTVFYGPDHPFGRMTTEQSVAAVTVDDCKAYLKDWIAPQGAKLFVVGDITQKQIETEIGGRLAAWKGKPKASVKIPAAKPRKGRIFFVDVPNAQQSSISLVTAGPTRKAKDYFPTRIAMAILGGGFSSRINMNIREDKGWAYGARGGINYSRTMGTFVAGASVKTDTTKDSITEIDKEVSKLAKDGEVTDAEFDREKNGAILALPAQFATGQQVLASFRGLLYFGLPLDYYASFVKNVSAVKKSDVAKAAKANLHPADVQVLVVGDAKAVLPGLKELIANKTLGEGDLVVLDADGNQLATP